MRDLSGFDPFFKSEAFGVVGASTNRDKYGNKVLRCYLQHSYKVYPVNPRADKIEGVVSVATLSDLPPNVKSISVITPPAITEKIVDEAILRGIKSIWMQPGSQSQAAIDKALKHGIQVIADGSCILVALGFKDV